MINATVDKLLNFGQLIWRNKTILINSHFQHLIHHHCTWSLSSRSSVIVTIIVPGSHLEGFVVADYRSSGIFIISTSCKVIIVNITLYQGVQIKVRSNVVHISLKQRKKGLNNCIKKCVVRTAVNCGYVLISPTQKELWSCGVDWLGLRMGKKHFHVGFIQHGAMQETFLRLVFISFSCVGKNRDVSTKQIRIAGTMPSKLMLHLAST